MDENYDLSLLERSQSKWDASEGLRAVYESIFAQMLALRAPGPTLEVGSGCGFIKRIDPSVVTSDIDRTPYVEAAVSAYAIPDREPSWANVLALDVLHHLADPNRFFRSAGAALAPGGRIVLCEPAATQFGRCLNASCAVSPSE